MCPHILCVNRPNSTWEGWRFQLTQLFSLTPDLQLYFTPAQATDNDFTTIVTLRLELAI